MPKVLRCDPSLLTKDLTDQVMIVTGANSGCGLETSRQLSKQGATVILACRSAEKGQAAAEDVKGVFLAPLDLSSLESVRAFVKTFQKTYDRLDALINNAGVMACPYAQTKEGFEWQIGCNHLAHFLLMDSLTPLLLKTAKKTKKPSRFVALSSVAATKSQLRPEAPHPSIDFDDMMFENGREYDEVVAYGQSKLANYLHAKEASRKYSAAQLLSTSVHPGWVRSNLDGHVQKKLFGEGFFSDLMAGTLRNLVQWKGDMISPQDGAQTTLYCVLEDADKMENGGFYSQFGIYFEEEQRKGGWPMDLKNPNGTPEISARLWKESKKLVKG